MHSQSRCGFGVVDHPSGAVGARVVVFELGKVKAGARGPGLMFVVSFVERVQIAQTTLRAVVGRHTLDETLSETDAINQNIREILDMQTEEWGIEQAAPAQPDVHPPISKAPAAATVPPPRQQITI